MTSADLPMTCSNHPSVETSLRCKQCNKPICPKCAVQTPTGYSCKECVRGHKRKFDTAEWSDYLLGSLIAGILSLIGSFLVSLIGSIGFIGWILVVISAPTAGAIIAETTRRVIKRHRAKSLFTTIIIAVGLGALPMVLMNLFRFNLFGILFQGVYLVLVVPAVYYRLSGTPLFK
jgi:hypothetical protein